MEDGIYIGVKSGKSTTTVHIPQEVQEFANQNKRVQDRLNDRNKKIQDDADNLLVSQAKAAKQAVRHIRARNRLIAQSAILLGAVAIVAFAAYLEASAKLIAAMVGAMALGTICFRVGRLAARR